VILGKELRVGRIKKKIRKIPSYLGGGDWEDLV
jgi:hypothetical protein